MSEILWSGLFGIVGVVLGWALTTASSNHGKLNIGINNAVYKNDGGVCIIRFEVVLFNDKRDKSGINCCKVIAEYDDGEKSEFIPAFENNNDKDELKELLTIDAKTMKVAKYEKSGIEYSGNTKYYFEYIINGKNKKKKVPIVFK